MEQGEFLKINDIEKDIEVFGLKLLKVVMFTVILVIL
jgi:hypothetical protein